MTTRVRKTRERSENLGTADENAPLFASARQLAAKIRRHQVAPLRAVDAIEAAASLPFDEGCERERALFFECVETEQAKALIHLFFAERASGKIAGLPPQTAARPIASVAIVGAGTMGGGIAMACANAGLSVTVKDATQEALDSRLCHHPQELRGHSQARPADAGSGRRTPRPHRLDARPTTAWPRPIS